MPGRVIIQDKPKEANQERAQLKLASQATPSTHAEPLRVYIAEAYPEELQPVNLEKTRSFFSTNQKQEFNSYT